MGRSYKSVQELSLVDADKGCGERIAETSTITHIRWHTPDVTLKSMRIDLNEATPAKSLGLT
jgi:hypothetical protein